MTSVTGTSPYMARNTQSFTILCVSSCLTSGSFLSERLLTLSYICLPHLSPPSTPNLHLTASMSCSGRVEAAWALKITQTSLEMSLFFPPKCSVTHCRSTSFPVQTSVHMTNMHGLNYRGTPSENGKRKVPHSTLKTCGTKNMDSRFKF